MELAVAGDNELKLRLIKSSLRQGEAHELANQFANSSILVIGSATTTNLGFYLPAPLPSSAQAMDTRATMRFLKIWIDWLRAIGVIQFGELSIGVPEQRIPSRFLYDPRIQALFGLSGLTPHTQLDVKNLHATDSIAALLATAPSRSIGSLIRNSSFAEHFEQWITNADLTELPKLMIPLFNVTSPIEAQASGLRFGLAYWNEEGCGNELIIGRMTHITIDLQGLIAHQEYPIDRYRLFYAPPDQNISRYPLDIIYQCKKDLALDHLLAGIPKLIKSVLLSFFQLTNESTFTSKSNDLQILDSFIEDARKIIDVECSMINKSVTENAFPFKDLAPSVHISRYLYAEGNSLQQQRRIDAIQTFPLAIKEAASGNAIQIENAIDNGQRLFLAISEAYQRPLWVSRRAQRTSEGFKTYGQLSIIDLATLMKLLHYLGPHAPIPSQEALLTLLLLLNSSLQVTSTSIDSDTYMSVLLNSISLQAQRDGWINACKSISSSNLIPRLYTIMHLLEIMRDNIEETLARLDLITLCENPTSIILTTLKKWLSGIFLQQLFALSFKLEVRIFRLMHGYSDQEFEVDYDISAKPLFGQFTLLNSRVEIRPLLTYSDLQTEGEAMRNCVASKYYSVIKYRALITSLHCLLTGERATLSIFRATDGNWKVRELKGPRNQAIATGSLLVESANELINLLNHSLNIFNLEIITLYEIPIQENDLSIQRHFENGRPIFHLLPSGIAASFEKNFPGSGRFDSRVLWAFEIATKSKMNELISQGEYTAQRSAIS